MDENLSAIDAVIQNWPWVVSLIAVFGAAIATLFRALMDVFFAGRTQKADHKQQRVLLHIEFIKELSASLDEQINQTIYSNNNNVGTTLGIEFAASGELGDLERLPKLLHEFAYAHLKSELDYLQSVAIQYGLGLKISKQIEALRAEIDSLELATKTQKDANSLNQVGFVLLKIQTLFRIVTHLLIDSLV